MTLQISSIVPRGWPDTYSQWLFGCYRYMEVNAKSGLPIYLNAEADDFQQIAILGSVPAHQSTIEGFVDSVRGTIKVDFENPQEAFRYYNSLRYWKANKYSSEIPPFLPVLLLTVLAAEQMRSDGQFVSSNYYGRLATLAGFLPEHKDKIGISYRRYIAPLWDSFNEWLTRHSQLGVPTAFMNVSQGFNDYVGVPIGQALLRSGEQETIESEFFERFFNSGGQKENIDREEFIENLDAWVTSLPISARIRSIYAQAQDVLRVGIWELFERWQPKTRGGQVSGRKAGLRFVLRLSSGLAGRTVRLSLNSNFDLLDRSICVAEMKNLALDLLPTTLQKDCYLGTGCMLTVDRSVSEVLGRSTSVSIRVGEEILFSATRDPRAIVPFETVVPGIWAEVDQMKLGDVYALLVASEMIGHTMALLEEHGSGACVSAVSGLPTQWKLISGFTPLSSLNAPDILPIQRVRGVQFSFVEGVRLPGGNGIPEYPLSEAPGFQVFQASFKKPVLRISGPSDWEREYPNLDEVVRPDFVAGGEYVARLFESPTSRSALSYRRFLLRDSSNPRSPPTGGSGAIGIRFTPTMEIFAGRARDESDDLALIQGARLLYGELPNWPATQATNQLEGKIFAGDEEKFDSDEVEIGISTELVACMLDPYAKHLHKKFDQVPGRFQRYQRWVCINCGASGQVDTKTRKTSSAPRPQTLRKQEVPIISPEKLVAKTFDPLPKPRETIESRLWALGGGDVREASSIAELHPLTYVSQVLWGLAVAGHIDITGMETDIASNEWQTNPLTVVSTPNGFRLVGHRTLEAESALAAQVVDHGGIFATDWLDRLTYISEKIIQGLDSESMESILQTLIDEGFDIALDNSVASQLLFALPPLSEIRDHLRTNSYQHSVSSTEYFDLVTGSWKPAVSTDLVGQLVRDSKYGINYWFVVDGNPANYIAASCGYRLGKHLSAHWNNVILMKYHGSAQELTLPLGAELPLLYSRALIFQSGSMPSRVAGKSVYSGVSEEMFEHLKFVLSE